MTEIPGHPVEDHIRGFVVKIGQHCLFLLNGLSSQETFVGSDDGHVR